MYHGHGWPTHARTQPRERSGAPTATPQLKQLARDSEELARWVHRKFNPAVLSYEDARDAAQDAYLEAARLGADVSQEPLRFRAWLRTTAYHRAIDHIRRRDGEERYGGRRALPASIEEITATEAERGLPASLRTEDTTAGPVLQRDAGAQRSAAIARAFGSLQPRELEAISLRYAEGLPVEACARAMGLSRSQFERVRARALLKLRIELSPSMVP